MSNTELVSSKVNTILEEIEKAFFDIPFENSAFQTKAFVIASQHTPARAYRAIGLRMMTKIQAIKEYIYNVKLEVINIEELEYKIADAKTTDFDRRRYRLEIEKKMEFRKWNDKLMNDAVAELNVLYTEFKKFPSYTREEFEAEEQKHFEIKLDRQIQCQGSGAIEALTNIHQDMSQLPQQITDAFAMLKGQREK